MFAEHEVHGSVCLWTDVPRPDARVHPTRSLRTIGVDMTTMRRLSTALGLGVFLLSLAATVLATRIASGNVQEDIDATFVRDSEEARSSVEQRVALYEGTLRGLRALFASSDTVSRDEFKTYVEVENIADQFPGIQALSFNRFVAAEDIETFEESVRIDRSVINDGYPDFAVYPVTDAVDHYVVDFLEPMAGNEAAFGFDLGSNQARRAAIEMARDTGAPVATAPITLVQETGEQSGFILMLPVYDNAMPQSTEAQRQQALQGTVNAVFRADDMLQGVLSSDRDIEIEVYDVGLASEVSEVSHSTEGILFDSDPTSNEAQNPSSARSATKEVAVGGRQWDLLVTQAGSGGAETILPWVVALLGLAVTIGATGATVTLARSRENSLVRAERLAYDASHDSLTGLANRAAAIDRLDHALARCARQGGLLGVMFIDLDHFKQVNDTHGHEAGDRLLVEVASVLQRTVRAKDTVCRFAGDEFVVVVEDIENTDDGLALAHRVCAAVEQVGSAQHSSTRCTASIGVAFSVDGDREAASLLHRADQAMYQAKGAGGNRVEVASEAPIDLFSL